MKYYKKKDIRWNTNDFEISKFREILRTITAKEESIKLYQVYHTERTGFKIVSLLIGRGEIEDQWD